MEHEIHCSIIIPVYCNAGSLEKTYSKLVNEVFSKNHDKNFETIFIDDGSQDNSLNVLLKLKEKYNTYNITIIKFSRNFGQQSAIFAGIKQSNSRSIVTISADLQDPPELINKMLDYHFKENFEIVICTREGRDESFYRRFTSKLFYRLIRKLSFPNMPKGGFDYMLFGEKTKEFILNNLEVNAFIQGMVLWSGYSIKEIPYFRNKREIGRSRWTFSKKIKALIDSVLSYSYFPLRLMSVMGSVIALTGFIYAIIIFISRLFGGIPVKGWAPIMIMILILSGVQMLMIGIIGEYLWRTLDQTRNRSLYIIEEIHE